MSEPKPMPTYWALAEEVTHLHGRLDQLTAENAKLRELVDYMKPIAWYAASERERDRMRELGVDDVLRTE